MEKQKAKSAKESKMTFIIAGEPFTFTLEVDQSNNLTAFTATDGQTSYDCSIQLVSAADSPVYICCTPSGCRPGSCYTS